jgi:ABC-type multidrug transport system ATPase subunit
MDEAEILSDRVAILYNGGIVALDHPKQLILDSGLQKKIVFSCKQCPHAVVEELSREFQYAQENCAVITVPSYDVKQDLATIFSIMEAHETAVDELSVELPSLEDVFFLKTGTFYPVYEKEVPSG